MAEQVSHTPGPWRFDEVDEDRDDNIAEHDHLVRYIRAEGTIGALMGGAKYYPWTPGSRADWVLIAAAPDLLAALKAMVASYDGLRDVLTSGIVKDKLAAAEAAIAKAEGR